jgi:hypothetical protein
MFETLPKTTTFEGFMEGKPDGILYELQDGVIVEGSQCESMKRLMVLPPKN